MHPHSSSFPDTEACIVFGVAPDAEYIVLLTNLFMTKRKKMVFCFFPLVRMMLLKDDFPPDAMFQQHYAIFVFEFDATCLQLWSRASLMFLYFDVPVSFVRHNLHSYVLRIKLLKLLFLL